MADVLTILGSLLALDIVFFGIFAAWWILFPVSVERTRLRVDCTPWQCFWLGCLVAVVLLPPIAALLFLPLVLTRIIGCFLILSVFALAGMGAAGLAAKIGGKLTPDAGISVSHNPLFVHGNIVRELAAGLWLGGVSTVILLPLIAVLLDLPFKLTWLAGCSLVFLIIALAGLVAAGLSTGRDTRSAPNVNDNTQSISAFLRGGVALELAAGFPVIGWFIIFPIIILMSMGAAVFALFRWMPRESETTVPENIRPKRIFIPLLALLWILPLIAISVAVVTFFLRGGVPVEMAAGFPFTGWCIVLSLYVIAVLGGTIFALWRRGHRRATPLATDNI
jgi:hypothetical protein